MDYDKWKNEAIMSIEQNVKIGETFTLKGLFIENQWSILTNGEKKGFGRYFSNEVKEEKVEGIINLGKAKNGTKLYKRVD